VKVSFVKGVIHSRFVHRELKTYTVKTARSIPGRCSSSIRIGSDFKLIAPEKAGERSRDVYRF